MPRRRMKAGREQRRRAGRRPRRGAEPGRARGSDRRVPAAGRALAGARPDRTGGQLVPALQGRDEVYRTLCRVPPRPDAKSLFAGINPAGLHSREPRQLPLLVASPAVEVLGNGILAKAKNANVVFCQMVPWTYDLRTGTTSDELSALDRAGESPAWQHGREGDHNAAHAVCSPAERTLCRKSCTSILPPKPTTHIVSTVGRFPYTSLLLRWEARNRREDNDYVGVSPP